MDWLFLATCGGGEGGRMRGGGRKDEDRGTVVLGHGQATPRAEREREGGRGGREGREGERARWRTIWHEEGKEEGREGGREGGRWGYLGLDGSDPLAAGVHLPIGRIQTLNGGWGHAREGGGGGEEQD